MLNQKLHFEDGRVSYHNQDIVIFEPPSLSVYALYIDNNPDLRKLLYHAAKEGILENKKNIVDSYKSATAVQWIPDVINLYAFGKISYIDTAPCGAMKLENSVLATALRTKVKNPPDVILCGMIAGLASIVSQSNLDCIETKCSAIDNEECTLIVDTKENLMNKYLEIYNKQV